MRKIAILVLLVLFMTNSAEARGGGGHYYGGWGYGGWFAPFMFGSMIGYAARPVVYYESSPMVIYTTAPQTMVIQNSGQLETPVSSTPKYEERWVYFDDCQCERKVLVNIQQ